MGWEPVSFASRFSISSTRWASRRQGPKARVADRGANRNDNACNNYPEHCSGSYRIRREDEREYSGKTPPQGEERARMEPGSAEGAKRSRPDNEDYRQGESRRVAHQL